MGFIIWELIEYRKWLCGNGNYSVVECAICFVRTNSGNTQTITPNLAAVLAENSANNTKIVNLADPTNPQIYACKQVC
jgi:hypothetical protein